MCGVALCHKNLRYDLRGEPGLRFALNLIGHSAFQPAQGTQHKPMLVAPGELAVTFIGHASFLLQVGGLNFLVDPVFANWLVLIHRLRLPGVRIEDLPAIDAVLLTHAHMDHLNFPSLRKIIRHTRRLRGKAPVAVVPGGVEDLVDKLGFADVLRMRWWESVRSWRSGDHDDTGAALGRADDSRHTSRLWRVRAAAWQSVGISLGRLGILHGFQGNWRAAGSGGCAAADWGVPA